MSSFVIQCAPVIGNAFYFCNVPPFLLFVVCFLKPLQSTVSDLDGNIKINTPSVQEFGLDTYLMMTWLFLGYFTASYLLIACNYEGSVWFKIS